MGLIVAACIGTWAWKRCRRRPAPQQLIPADMIASGMMIQPVFPYTALMPESTEAMYGSREGAGGRASNRPGSSRAGKGRRVSDSDSD